VIKSARLKAGVLTWGGEKETDFDSFNIEIMYNIYSNNAYLNRDK
jgi:hypothetical protein